MKKKSITRHLLGFLVTSILFCSCQNSVNQVREVSETNVDAYAQLESEIKDYNFSFNSTYPLETKLSWKEFWNAVKGIARIVVADVSGALSGMKLGQEIDKMNPSADGNNKHTGAITIGIVNGVSASVATGIQEFGSNNNKNVKKNREFVFTEEETGSIVGEAHNKIMKVLFEQYDKKGVTDPSIDRIVKDVFTITQNYIEKKELSFPISEAETNKIIIETSKISKSLEKVSDLEAIGYLRNSDFADKKDLDLIADYLLKIKTISNLELRKEYASGYAELIKKSKLSEISKTTILTGTSTAINSLTIWQP